MSRSTFQESRRPSRNITKDGQCWRGYSPGSWTYFWPTESSRFWDTTRCSLWWPQCAIVCRGCIALWPWRCRWTICGFISHTDWAGTITLPGLLVCSRRWRIWRTGGTLSRSIPLYRWLGEAYGSTMPRFRMARESAWWLVSSGRAVTLYTLEPRPLSASWIQRLTFGWSRTPCLSSIWWWTSRTGSTSSVHHGQRRSTDWRMRVGGLETGFPLSPSVQRRPVATRMRSALRPLREDALTKALCIFLSTFCFAIMRWFDILIYLHFYYLFAFVFVSHCQSIHSVYFVWEEWFEWFDRFEWFSLLHSCVAVRPCAHISLFRFLYPFHRFSHPNRSFCAVSVELNHVLFPLYILSIFWFIFTAVVCSDLFWSAFIQTLMCSAISLWGCLANLYLLSLKIIEAMPWHPLPIKEISIDTLQQTLQTLHCNPKSIK